MSRIWLLHIASVQAAFVIELQCSSCFYASSHLEGKHEHKKSKGCVQMGVTVSVNATKQPLAIQH